MTGLNQQKKEKTDSNSVLFKWILSMKAFRDDSNLVLFMGILSLFGPILGGGLFAISNSLIDLAEEESLLYIYKILKGVSVLFLLCGMFGGWGLYFANEALAKYDENHSLYNNNDKGKLIVGKVFSIINLLFLAVGFLIFVVSGAVMDFSKL